MNEQTLDPILMRDYARMNQMLEVRHDNGYSFDLLNEATRIRRDLAADTGAPDWLRGMAEYVVGEMRA